MDACSQCPHTNDCLKMGSCLDELNAPFIRTRQAPRLMTPEQANACMSDLKTGCTIRRITGGGKFGSAIVSFRKFSKHCSLYPEWGAEADRLAKINAKAGDVGKSVNSPKRKQTQEVCLKGLHQMKGDNLMMHKGRRACLACWRHHAANPPIHSILPVLDLIKDDLRRGISAGQICHGRPTGGGKVDRRLVRVRPNVFYRYRQLNPDFNQFVLEAIADSKSVGQKIRFSRHRARLQTARVRKEANDYHKIRDMIPASNPHRDDIVARIFEDMLSGNLDRENVQGRVRYYVTEYNRIFPTKYAKFGNSPLVSLDEVLFDNGSMTRGDTISRGLWD
jgi:hypothetical protein